MSAVSPAIPRTHLTLFALLPLPGIAEVSKSSWRGLRRAGPFPRKTCQEVLCEPTSIQIHAVARRSRFLLSRQWRAGCEASAARFRVLRASPAEPIQNHQLDVIDIS